MLTQYDIDIMESTVMDILESWGMTVSILVPKSEDKQPNWNPIMREYTGNIMYDIIRGVPTERLEVVNEYHSNRNHIKAGTKTESSMLYKLPTWFNGEPLVITPDMIFIFDNNRNEKYQINTIRNRIGETIVDIDLIVGGTDSGTYGSDTGASAILGRAVLGSMRLGYGGI